MTRSHSILLPSSIPPETFEKTTYLDMENIRKCGDDAHG